MSEWQPMKTAPKDGTKILAFVKDIRCVLEIYWNFGWSTQVLVFNKPDEYFTHWMALPEPPIKKHRCHIMEDFYCEKNCFGHFIIHKDRNMNEIPEYPCLPVRFCPMCGEKA